MSWIAVAIGGSAVLGYMGSQQAAGQQSAAQQQAAATQKAMFDTINKQQQPFIQSGYGANQTLSDMMKPGGYLTQQFNPTQQQLEQYPGYQFAQQQGQQATLNADTPGQGAMSGAALKDLTSFATNTAATHYGDYFNQFQTQQNNIFNRLSGLTQIGQNAAANVGSAGTQLGTGVAQAQAAAGGSQAAGTVGAANALSGGLSMAALMNGAGYNYGGGTGAVDNAGYTTASPNFNMANTGGWG